MKKELKEINVGELLSEIDSSTEGNVLSKAASNKRDKATYEFVFADRDDFAIQKKTKRTVKTLVSILSKNLLFIKDENTNKITKVVEDKQMQSFFNDLKEADTIIPQNAVMYADKDITKGDIPNLFRVLTESEAFKRLLFADILSFNDLKSVNSKNLDDYYQLNKNLFKYIITTREHNYKGESYELFTIIAMAYDIYSISDLDSAKYFVDKQKMSSIKLSRISYFEKFKDYNLNTRRFVDYILFDLYKQGASGGVLDTYIDYLNMSKEYYGYVKEKYPKALRTEHDILALKIAEKRKIGENSNDFERVMNECENFAYQTPLDKFIIKMPKVAMDLVDEGTQLNHCVASYVNKVVTGDCVVVFMREKENPDESYLTIEILPDRSVSQIEGLNKRHDLTDKEQEFIKKWAKARHLKITAENIERK